MTTEPFLIDSHCHLHDPEFFSSAQQAEFLAHAQENNVRQIVCIGTSPADSARAQAFAAQHPEVFWTFGVHPECAGTHFTPSELNPALSADSLTDSSAVASADISASPSAQSSTQSTKLVAIGEIGLDYHYAQYDRVAQIRLFEEMLDLALRLDLPCSFHVRDALPDFFAIVKNFPRLRPSVLHSFTDSPDNLEIALAAGFYIGINGIATFANLPCYRELPRELLTRLVLETDAPFLTPVPERGIINRPGNVKHIAAWLSSKTGISMAEIATITTQNVQQLYHLPDPWSAS